MQTRIAYPIPLLATITLALTAQTSPQPPDKYQWLEDVNGPRSLAWVKTENERSAKALESDPHFPALEAAELKLGCPRLLMKRH